MGLKGEVSGYAVGYWNLEDVMEPLKWRENEVITASPRNREPISGGTHQ